MSSKLGVQNIAHTNGTNAMTVDGSGNATFAKNISQTDLQFWSGYHDQAEAPGVGGTLVYWSASDNNGITESSGIWTIAVSGIYLFSISLLANTATGGIRWQHNSTPKWRLGYTETPANYNVIGGTLLHQFSANDTLRFIATAATSFYGSSITIGSSADTVSSMCICKIG
jgi:hypothetical protein